METHGPSHLYLLELSLTHNYFLDTLADEELEDNSIPSKDFRETNSMESTNKVTITRSKRKKKLSKTIESPEKCQKHLGSVSINVSLKRYQNKK